MPKVLNFFPLFLIFINAIIFTPRALAQHPACDINAIKGVKPLAEKGDIESCPPDTCYSDSGIDSSVRYACYKIEAKQPPPPNVPTITGTASILVEPSSIQQGDKITYTVSGKGFGGYIFFNTIAGQGSLGYTRTPETIVFIVGDKGCTFGGQNSVFNASLRNNPNHGCRVVDPSEQTWTMKITRPGYRVDQKFEAGLLSADGKSIITLKGYTVGNPTSEQLNETLKVSIDPPGPFNNDVDNEVTITWSPANFNADYLVDTNFPSHIALPGVKHCTSSTNSCSRTGIIPKAVPEGDISFIVTEEGSANRGVGTVKVIAVIAPDVTIAAQTQQKPLTQNSRGGGESCDPETGALIANGKGVMTAIGCVPTEPQAFVNGVIRYGTLASGGLALLLMILASVRYIFSEGNPDNIKKAWDQFLNAFIGLLFILFSVLLLELIGVDILGIPGLSG